MAPAPAVFRCRWLAPIIACLLAPLGLSGQITAPAYNWSLPVFSADGEKTMVARGGEAQMSAPGRFEVVDMNLTMFSDNPKDPVDSVILSPAATFLPDAKIARGDRMVRFIGRGVDATGVHWVYYHDQKKISLEGSVRVTFNAELKDLLK